MGNSLRKKQEAAVFNASNDLMKDLFPVGVCCCGGNLFMYLKSEDENLYNVYCDAEDCGVSDIRDPVDGDRYFWSPQKVVDELLKTFGADRIEATFTQPHSPIVNNAKADRAFEVNLDKDDNPREQNKD